MKNPEIAQIILQQMGGQNRLKAMVGAYNYLDHGDGVSFRFKGSKVANYVKVTLTPMDMYNIELGKIWGQKYTIKVLKHDVFNDQLIPIFQNTTKLYLSL